MGFRITTNMVMNTYRYNLQNSTKKLSDARDMVLTQRKFGSYAEDPAAATLAFRLRRDYIKTSNYLANTKDVYSKFNTAWHNLAGVIGDLSDRTARVSSIRGNNDTTAEARRALAVDLRETANSVVQAMNQKLGDHFIFGGNDALNAPFSWSEDGTILYYRGVNVNAGGVRSPAWAWDTGAAPGPVPIEWGEIDANTGLPMYMPAKADNEYEQAWMDYYNARADAIKNGDDPDSGIKNPSEPPDWASNPDYFLDDFGTPDVEAIMKDSSWEDSSYDKAWLAYYQDHADYNKLVKMSGEEMYIDLGMGAAEKSPNNPVRGTYFNNALCGIDFLGFGVDANGDPKNLALIMKELADVFETWDEDTQSYNPELAQNSAAGLSSAQLEAKAYRLMDKLKAAQESTTEHYVELDANSVYLQSSQTRLEIQMDDIAYQILDIEQVDMADAITTFSWEYTCYNAALKIGTQLLGQSLIDYMR